MTTIRWSALFLLAAACGGAPEAEEPAPAPAPATAPAPEGEQAAADADDIDVVVKPVYHATVVLQIGDSVWWVDPWSKGPIADFPKADVILVTDIHPDHLDNAAIATVAKEGAVLVAPAAAAEKLERGVTHVLANDESVTVRGVKVTAVPMYNLERGPESGAVFHEKGRGNGYLLDVDDDRIYIAGDTECTPEMKALEDVSIAFVPMNLPYTMPPEEAAECVKAFAPEVVIPYHYGDSDLDAFEAALGETETVVTRVDFYPGGLPF